MNVLLGLYLTACYFVVCATHIRWVFIQRMYCHSIFNGCKLQSQQMPINALSKCNLKEDRF